MCGSMYISNKTINRLVTARDERIIKTAILMASIVDSMPINEGFINLNGGCAGSESYGETASRRYIAGIAAKLTADGKPTSIVDLWEVHIKNNCKE